MNSLTQGIPDSQEFLWQQSKCMPVLTQDALWAATAATFGVPNSCQGPPLDP